MPKLADLYGVDLNRLGKFNKTDLPDNIEAMVQDFAEKRGAAIASR